MPKTKKPARKLAIPKTDSLKVTYRYVRSADPADLERAWAELAALSREVLLDYRVALKAKRDRKKRDGLRSR